MAEKIENAKVTLGEDKFMVELYYFPEERPDSMYPGCGDSVEVYNIRLWADGEWQDLDDIDESLQAEIELEIIENINDYL